MKLNIKSNKMVIIVAGAVYVMFLNAAVLKQPSKDYADANVQIVEMQEQPQESEEEVAFVGKNFDEIEDKPVALSIPNDSTKSWKKVLLETREELQGYAADYYNKYMQDSADVHFLLNFTNNTTTVIRSINDEVLEVTVSEFVHGSEHNAKEINNGDLYAVYRVSKTTGEVQEIK